MVNTYLGMVSREIAKRITTYSLIGALSITGLLGISKLEKKLDIGKASIELTTKGAIYRPSKKIQGNASIRGFDDDTDGMLERVEYAIPASVGAPLGFSMELKREGQKFKEVQEEYSSNIKKLARN